MTFAVSENFSTLPVASLPASPVPEDALITRILGSEASSFEGIYSAVERCYSKAQMVRIFPILRQLKALRDSHSDTLLGRALKEKKVEFAKELTGLGFLVSIETIKEIAGPNLLYYGSNTYHYGLSLQEQGNQKEALKSLLLACKILTEALPDGHPFIGECNNSAGVSYQREKAFSLAYKCHRIAYDIFSKLPSCHTNLVFSLINLGHCLVNLGRPKEAAFYYQKAAYVGQIIQHPLQ